MSQIQNAIDFCRANKYSFLPVNSISKKPLISWKEFQTRFPTDDEVTQWLKDFPTMSIGIVTGKISNLIVVDLDKPDDTPDGDTAWIEHINSQINLPKTFTVRSGGGGLHYYYAYTGLDEIKNSTGVIEHVDIRGEGGYIMAPGSTHSSGNIYEVIDTNDSQISDCPKWVHEKQIEEKSGHGEKKIKGRNDKSTKWIGGILKKYDESQWDEAWQEMLEFNSLNNTPPLDEAELRTIFESICKSEQNKRDGKTDTQVNRCIKLLEDNGRFIRDQIGDAYFVCRIGESQRLIPVESSSFRDWIQNNYHKIHKSVISPNLLKSIESLAKCRASETNEVQQVDIRIQKIDETILYDLLDENLSCVWIDSEGWRISGVNPGFFKRGKNNYTQVSPVSGGDIGLLWNYINITDPRMRTLILTTLVTRFVPDIQHPILMIHGPKGSAKSTFLEVIKTIIDPSSKGLLSLPSESNALIHTFLTDYLLCYDNISKISNDTSDDLCRAVSGNSLSKRKLHTDSDDIIYKFMKAICINGINLEANQPDLLQRSIIIQLEAVTNRITPSKFWESFAIDLPQLLGCIFQILSEAIKIKNSLDDNQYEYERLADYHKWGESICQVLGFAPGHFGELLKENMGIHDEVALSSNIATTLLLEFMKTRSYWEGTPTELRNELYILASSRGESRYLPASPHSLMNTLNRYKENLMNVGITVKSIKSGNRTVQIENIGDIDSSDPFK